MQLLEITLGAEHKRPGAQQYSSDTTSAYIKLAVHPGDNLDDVLTEGRRILEAALNPTTPAAPAAPPAWLIRVTGPGMRRTDLPRAGFRFRDGDWIAERPNETDAERMAETARLIDPRATVTITPPAGGA